MLKLRLLQPLVLLILSLLINRNVCEYIAATITPASNIISQYTTYSFVIYRSNNPVTSSFISPVASVPATAYIQLNLPSDYSNWATNTTLNCVNVLNMATLSCTANIQANIISIANIFTSSAMQTAQMLSINISGIRNPSRSVATANFQYYIKHQNGSLIDQSPSAASGIYSTSITFQPAAFSTCSISANNNFVSTRSRLTFSFKTTNAIPSNGQLTIDIPLSWDGDLDQSTTVVSNPTCTPISGISSAVCTYQLLQSPINIARITVTSLSTSGIVAGSEFTIDIASILTPPYTNYISQVQMYSAWSDETKIDTCTQSIKNITPIPFSSIQFTVQSGTTTVQSVFTAKLSLRLSTAFSSQDQISLFLPNNFLTNNQISITSSIYAIFSTTVKLSANNSGTTQVVLSNFPAAPSQLPANNIFSLFLNNIYNFDSVQPQTITATFYRSSQPYQQSSTTYAATLGTFSSFDITSSSVVVRNIGASLVTINSQFRIGIGSTVQITYNSAINAADLNSSSISYAALNGILASNVSYRTTLNVISVANLFQASFTNGTIEIQIPLFVNPPTIRPTPYLLTIRSNTGHQIATATYTYTASLQAFKSNSATLTSSSYKVMDTGVTYTIQFQTFYGFSSVSILIPPDVSTNSGFEATCTPNTFTSCSITSLPSGFNNLTFRGTVAAGVQTLSWGNNINPNSYKPTSSFELSTFLNGWGVQKSTGHITLTMNQQANVLSAQVVPSNYTNDAIINLQIDFILPARSPNGTITISIPNVIDISNSICSVTNIGTCTIIPPRLSINFVNPATNNVISSSITLSNVVNAPSFKTVDNFNITLISSDNFQSLSSTFSAWTNIQLSTFTTSVSSNVGFRGENALFTLNLAGLSGKQTFVDINININFGALNSNTTPIGATFLNSYSIRYNIFGQGSVQLSFILQTPIYVGNYTFSLTTLTSDLFRIGSSVSNIWQHSCYGTQCRSCNGTRCLSCYNSTLTQFFRLNVADSTCIQACPSGFYLDNSNNCIPCSQNCLQCSNLSTYCTMCPIYTNTTPPTVFYLNTIFNTCVQQCSITYYPNQLTQQCSPCIHPCYTCTSDFICLTCSIGYYLVAASSSCVTSCPANVMVANNVTQTCDFCSNNCLTCSLFDYNCTSCNNTQNLYLDVNVCVTNCSVQKFLVNNICTPCQPPCRVCFNSTTDCLSCMPNTSFSLWYNYKCISASQCVVGHYVNSVNGSCDPCLTQCQQCISLVNCSACSAGFYLFANTCITSCPNITYSNNNSLTCDACVGCVTCTSLTVCTSCQSNQFFYLSACYSACPNGTYSSTGLAPTVNVNISICVVCPIGCPTCVNATFCLSCLPQQYLYRGVCYQTCPISTYPSSPVCLNCPTTCRTCTTSTNCLTCATGYSLQNSACVLNCRLGISFNQICYPCGLNCALCQNTTCTRCQLSYYLFNNVCMSQCAASTLTLDNMTCVPCSDKFVNCTTCSQTACLSCLDGQLTNGQCLPCIPGTYSHNSMCVSCPSVCNICTGQTSCSSCSSGYYLEADYCVDTCPNNKVPNGTKCDICIANCSRCNLQTKLCSICTAGMYQFEGQCFEKCPDPYVTNLNLTLCVTQQQYTQQYSKASKPIYFPFTIAVVIAVIIGISLNCYIKTMHLTTFLVAIIGWLQLACWILFGVIQYLFYTNLQTQSLRGIILVLTALVSLIISNFVFLRFYYKYFVDDIDFVKWERRHGCINIVFVALATIFSFKVHRLIYSKVLERDQLSLVLSSTRKLVPISVLSVISIFLSSAPVIVGSAFALYYSLNQDQQFFNALDTLVVTSIMAFLMIIDLKHKHSYFIDEVETQNIRNKIYQQDYEQFSINKKSEKLKDEDFEKGSNLSRQHLVEGADTSNLLDHMTTAKKFRTNKNKTQKIQQGAEFNETLRDNISGKNKRLGELDQSKNALNSQQLEYKQDPLQQFQQQQPSKSNWVQKQYDHHGYLIKYDSNNNIIRYDKNGHRVQINQNGQHAKYDENGYLIKQDPQTGKLIKYDSNGFIVVQDGTRLDQRGYVVEKSIDSNGQTVLKYYDQNGYQVIVDPETNQQVLLDKKGNKVKIDPITKQHKVYNKQGYQIIYGQNGKQDMFKNQHGQYVRYNKKAGIWQQYDPTDGFLIKKNQQTGEYQKFDQYGFKIQKDQYGNIYRYDQRGNRVVIGIDGDVKRYDKQGYQIKRDALTGKQTKYDKQGYQVRINPQTNEKVFYDEHGYIIQRDFYGKVTRYDQAGNLVIIDPQTKKHRKFNPEGLQIIQDGKGGTYLKDKRGRKVLQLQQGFYQKYDEDGNKIWLDQEGYEIQTDQNGNIRKYDKVGDPVSEDEDEQQKQVQGWKIDEDKGDNLIALPTKPKKNINKFKVTKQFDFEQQYSKMVTNQNKPQLLFDFEDQLEDTDNLRQFHDIEPVKQYELEKQYQTLYNDQAEKQHIRRQNSLRKIRFNLQDLGEVDHTPYVNLNEKVRKGKNTSRKQDDDQLNKSELMIQPEISQSKHQIKSVADVSISQKSFVNEGVQPLTEKSKIEDDEIQSLNEVDISLANMKKNNKNGRSDANFNKSPLKNQGRNNTKSDRNSQIRSGTKSQNNFLNPNSSRLQVKQPVGHKIYDSEQQVQSLGQQEWQNQQVDIVYKDNHNSRANTNTHVKGQIQQQSDILSDYIPQPAEEQYNRHKASEENLLHKKYMQSIEEVEDELFEKLKSQDHRVKRTDFRLSGTPNPLVQYAKTIDAKKMQEQIYKGKGKRDRYFGGSNSKK